MTKTDLKPYDSLSVVEIDGFDASKALTAEHIDPPGTANWLCEQYGMAPGDFDPAKSGIIWTDYDRGGWRFAVLIATAEVEALTAFAKEAGYDVSDAIEITEPCNFGDHIDGTVEILRHRDGWVVID